MDLLSKRDIQSKQAYALYKNVCLLNLWRPVSKELKQLLRNDLFDKPNQAAFIHLSHYLIYIIDANKAAQVTWPLLEKKAEHVYRGQLVTFISNLDNEHGTLTPIMSSYLVNAGGYKIVRLMFQLSQMAMKCAIEQKLKKNDEKLEALNTYISYLKGDKEIADFNNCTDKVLSRLRIKTSDWHKYKKNILHVSELLKMYIVKLEKESEGGTLLLEKVVNSFLEEETLDEVTKEEIRGMFDVSKPSVFLEKWSSTLDMCKLQMSESRWTTNAGNILSKALNCKTLCGTSVLRHTVKDKSSYTLSHSEKDHFNTSDFEKQVSSQESYVLKNVVQNGTLNFPVLLKAYLVTLCFIFRRSAPMNESSLSHFNMQLDQSRGAYAQLKLQMKELIAQMYVMDQSLKIHSYPEMNLSIQENEFTKFPPLPVLKFIDRYASKFSEHQKAFTPINIRRIQFNFNKFLQPVKQNHMRIQVERPPRTTFKENGFLKRMANVRSDIEDLKSFAIPAMSKTLVNPVTTKLNQTVADCTTVFSKQQIARLLSSKKTANSQKKSSQKKYDQSLMENHRDKKWNVLFNVTSNSPLYKSYSSPNLQDSSNQRLRTLPKTYKARNICSIVMEDSPDSVNVSNFSMIQCESPTDCFNKTPDKSKLNGSNNVKATSSPTISNVPRQSRIPVFNKDFVDKNSGRHPPIIVNDEVVIEKVIPDEIVTENEADTLSELNHTPSSRRASMNNSTKSRSIERIMDRFKKYKDSVKVCNFKSQLERVKISIETKEKNFNQLNVDVQTSFPKNLPDLLSPNHQILGGFRDIDSVKIFSPDDQKYCPRQSLGQALGVDNTFLDQFDLID